MIFAQDVVIWLVMTKKAVHDVKIFHASDLNISNEVDGLFDEISFGDAYFTLITKQHAISCIQNCLGSLDEKDSKNFNQRNN